MQAAGFVLAGGKSTRMGRDKALLEIDGEPLVCADVAIAGGGAELARFAPLIEDAHAGCGPLGGIVAALEISTYEWNCFLAVDVPFIPESVWCTLLDRARGSDAVAVLAEANGYPQPLVGVYRRRSLPVLRDHLRAKTLKVMQAIRAAGKVEFVPFRQGEWFQNVNTPEEYGTAAERMVGEP